MTVFLSVSHDFVSLSAPVRSAAWYPAASARAAFSQ